VVDGLEYHEDPVRVYEYNALASHVIGFVNYEGKGIEGIERSYNDELAGKPGSRFVLKDGKGAVISILEENYKDAVPGANIQLTIDKTTQLLLEKELAAGVKAAKAISALGIVMDPNTGEVLALANYPGYDPGKYMDFSDEVRRNKAVSDIYDPGSTFKGISFSGLLDLKLVTPQTVVDIGNGTLKYYGHTINDHISLSSLTVREVLRYSSNIGTIKLINRISDNEFYKYLRSYGFGNYTYLGLPGEVKGMLPPPVKWSKSSKGSMAYGYGVSVTPIQLITAYSALVNGGTLYKPLLIKALTDQNGQVIQSFEPTKIRDVITPETSALMRVLLTDVVEKGTGKKAQVEGVKIGGKTGTSRRIMNGGYTKKSYNSSFIGFFPADKPKYICLILVNTHKQTGITGGEVAAPIFKNVASVLSGKKSETISDISLVSVSDEDDEEIIAPEGGKQESQTKDVFVPVTQIKKAASQGAAKGIMPDLRGTSLKDAIGLIQKMDLKLTWSGTGRVVEQSIKPGQKPAKGSVIELKLQERAISGVNIY
jgi:Cell division protein FtsI/penicillin-binding protein 2